MVWPAARPAQQMKTKRAIGLSFILAKATQAQPPLRLAQATAHSSSSLPQVYSSEKFDREKSDEVRLAQTSDYLSGSRVAGDSDLFPGSGVARRRRGRQLDQVGFSGPYLLDLHHAGRCSRHLEFHCCPVISQGRSVADSLGLDGSFRDPSRYGCRRLRQSAPSGHVQRTPSVDGESQTSNERDSTKRAVS